SDGSVLVSAAQDAEAQFASVPLVVNEELTIPSSGGPSKAHVNASQKLGWAWGRLEFTQGDTVGYAVARFNGFNRIKVQVDERTARRQMRGTFDANDPVSFALAVKETIGGSLVEETPDRVRIEPPRRQDR